MRILDSRRLLLGAALLLGVVSTASAQDKSLYNKVFFETFMVRCMAPAHGGLAYNTEKMTRVADRLAKHWLDGGPGSVWSPDLSMKVLLVLRGDGSCMVVSADGDAAAMKARVAKWFDEPPSPFERDVFRPLPDGGFESKYHRDCGGGLWCSVIINARGEAKQGQLALMAMAARVRP